MQKDKTLTYGKIQVDGRCIDLLFTEKLNKFKQVHISPCSFDSDESRNNVKREVTKTCETNPLD